MEERPYTGFYARLTGGFSLEYEGKPLMIHGNLHCRYMQLLLLLLKAGQEGIDREEFFQVSGLEAVNAKKRTSNFRQQLYKLRKAIRESRMPEGRYAVLRRGRYYFTLEYALHTDAEELDQIICQIRQMKNKAGQPGEKEEDLFWQYCRTYGGEFLPMLSGEEWATTGAAYYQKWYSKCLKELSARLKEQNQYEQLLELSMQAGQYHPYDGWQALQIECLLALKRLKEAKQVYEKTAEMFSSELGLSSADPVLGSFAKGIRSAEDTGNRIFPDCGRLSRIKAELEEDEEPYGAYCCSYPSFLDICHIIGRIGERGQTKNTLLLCTLDAGESRKEGRLPGQARELWMGRLKQFLETALRTEDVYTQYSDCQYLAVLAGADEAAGKEAAKRLRQKWEKSNRAGPCQVRFAAQEMEHVQAEENGCRARDIS